MKKNTESELLAARVELLEYENQKLKDFILRILNHNLKNYKELLQGYIAEFTNGDSNNDITN